jgi:hypothetical protein
MYSSCGGLSILQMSHYIPDIEADPNKPLGLKDKLIGKNDYGIIMEMEEQGYHITNLIICSNCKYFWGGDCHIHWSVFGECGTIIGQYQYYK